MRIFLYLLCFVYLMSNNVIIAQINYVPNHSFEDITDCDLEYGDSDKAVPWLIDNYPIASPDLYHACSNSGFYEVPLDYGCTVIAPKSGDGMVALAQSARFAEERIFVWLTDDLPLNVDIYVAHYVFPSPRCGSNPYNILCYANTHALAFVDERFEIDIILELEDPLDYIEDWTLMQTCYQANGEEEMVFIGNYKPAAEVILDCEYIEPNGNNSSYTFVDDVIVSPFDVVPDTLFLCGDDVINIDFTFYEVPISWTDGWQGAQRTITEAGTYTVLGDVEDCFLTDQTVVIHIPDESFEEKVKFCEDGETLLQSPVPAVWPSGDTSQRYLVKREGIYQAKLLSSCGERTIDYIVEETDCNIEYFIPNVFSPNDDGINDQVEFLFRSDFEFTGELYIFDRWGKRIFTAKGVGSTDPAYWDGTYQGEPLNPAVFVWAYRYTSSKDGRTRVVSGDITLVR